MSIGDRFKWWEHRSRKSVEITTPRVVETEWRPPTVSILETPRDRFLRERRHRRRAANRTRNAVAKQARKVNRGAYSGR